MAANRRGTGPVVTQRKSGSTIRRSTRAISAYGTVGERIAPRAARMHARVIKFIRADASIVKTSAFAMPMALASRALSFGRRPNRAANVARARATRAAPVATRAGASAVASSKCGAWRPGPICASVPRIRRLKVSYSHS